MKDWGVLILFGGGIREQMDRTTYFRPLGYGVNKRAAGLDQITKGMFKGKDSRVECRSLGQRGEKVLTRVRAIKNSQTGIETKNKG